MMGGIRDGKMAVRAALVGRLVLPTLHVDDAVAAVDRLHDLGVPRYLIAATLRGVLSQRLVRRVHQDCGGAGCGGCGGTGRQVMSELLSVTAALADAVAKSERGAALQALAEAEGFAPLETDGRSLVARGLVDRRDLQAFI